jgi:hypothetical protein
VIRHGENGLVIGFDDPNATAAALDLLARNRSLLRRLSAGAVESMIGWPSADQAAAAFAIALTEVAEAAEPGAAHVAATWKRWRAAAELARTERGEVEFALWWQQDQLESLTSSRTYKLAQGMQRASHLLRR